jgi:hypothetical protein
MAHALLKAGRDIQDVGPSMRQGVHAASQGIQNKRRACNTPVLRKHLAL